MKKSSTKATTTTKSTGKPAKALAAVASDGQVLAASTTPKGKPVAAVAAKAGKAAKPAKAVKQSPTAVIRQLLAADPAIEADALEAALAKQGLNPPKSTITTVRADFLGCLKALQAAGRVKLH